MIQLIGLMVGFYIFVRYLEIYQHNKTKSLQGFSILGIFVTIILMIGILASWATVPKL